MNYRLEDNMDDGEKYNAYRMGEEDDMDDDDMPPLVENPLPLNNTNTLPGPEPGPPMMYTFAANVTPQAYDSRLVSHIDTSYSNNNFVYGGGNGGENQNQNQNQNQGYPYSYSNYSNVNVNISPTMHAVPDTPGRYDVPPDSPLMLGEHEHEHENEHEQENDEDELESPLFASMGGGAAANAFAFAFGRDAKTTPMPTPVSGFLGTAQARATPTPASAPSPPPPHQPPNLPSSRPRPTPKNPNPKNPTHIPRPPNAFILFRSAFVRAQRIPPSIEGNHSTLSKIVGMCWRGMGRVEREVWERRARAAKAEHRRVYPDWRWGVGGGGGYGGGYGASVGGVRGGGYGGRRKGKVKDGGGGEGEDDESGGGGGGSGEQRPARKRRAPATSHSHSRASSMLSTFTSPLPSSTSHPHSSPYFYTHPNASSESEISIVLGAHSAKREKKEKKKEEDRARDKGKGRGKDNAEDERVRKIVELLGEGLVGEGLARAVGEWEAGREPKAERGDGNGNDERGERIGSGREDGRGAGAGEEKEKEADVGDVRNEDMDGSRFRVRGAPTVRIVRGVGGVMAGSASSASASTSTGTATAAPYTSISQISLGNTTIPSSGPSLTSSAVLNIANVSNVSNVAQFAGAWNLLNSSSESANWDLAKIKAKAKSSHAKKKSEGDARVILDVPISASEPIKRSYSAPATVETRRPIGGFGFGYDGAGAGVDVVEGVADGVDGVDGGGVDGATELKMKSGDANKNHPMMMTTTTTVLPSLYPLPFSLRLGDGSSSSASASVHSQSGLHESSTDEKKNANTHTHTHTHTRVSRSRLAVPLAPSESLSSSMSMSMSTRGKARAKRAHTASPDFSKRSLGLISPDGDQDQDNGEVGKRGSKKQAREGKGVGAGFGGGVGLGRGVKKEEVDVDAEAGAGAGAGGGASGYGVINDDLDILNTNLFQHSIHLPPYLDNVPSYNPWTSPNTYGAAQSQSQSQGLSASASASTEPFRFSPQVPVVSPRRASISVPSAKYELSPAGLGLGLSLGHAYARPSVSNPDDVHISTYSSLSDWDNTGGRSLTHEHGHGYGVNAGFDFGTHGFRGSESLGYTDGYGFAPSQAFGAVSSGGRMGGDDTNPLLLPGSAGANSPRVSPSPSQYPRPPVTSDTSINNWRHLGHPQSNRRPIPGPASYQYHNRSQYYHAHPDTFVRSRQMSYLDLQTSQPAPPLSGALDGAYAHSDSSSYVQSGTSSAAINFAPPAFHSGFGGLGLGAGLHGGLGLGIPSYPYFSPSPSSAPVSSVSTFPSPIPRAIESPEKDLGLNVAAYTSNEELTLPGPSGVGMNEGLVLGMDTGSEMLYPQPGSADIDVRGLGAMHDRY